jgi:hypothetical protein
LFVVPPSGGSAIKNGDRTPLACYRRRPAVDFVEPSFSLFGEESLSDEICGETPQITRQRRVLPFFQLHRYRKTQKDAGYITVFGGF